MKTIKKLVAIPLLMFLISSTAYAQEFDSNRMNRDITIMENILSELFKTKVDGVEELRVGQVRLASFGNMGRNKVSGAYLPGYGVIFRIPLSANGRVASIIVNRNSDSDSDDKAGVSFYYNSEDSDYNQENITKRITEFLRDYAPTIGQLKPNEKVMIIHGASSSGWGSPEMSVFFSNNSTDNKEEKLPIISASVTKKDLDDLRSGKINESAFNSRLKVNTSEEKEYVDLKVMSNIFETALQSGGKESFRMSRGQKVNALKLDDFGVIFSMTASYSNRAMLGTVIIEDKEIRERIRGSIEATEVRAVSAEEARKERGIYNMKVQEALKKLKTDLSDYILDYGRTLSSISSNEMLLVSVTINETASTLEIPERIDFQVKKSVLESLDKGNISRENALKEILVSEY